MTTPAGLMGPLTGLSSKNATNHMLGGETQTRMQQLWHEYSTTTHGGSLSSKEVESFTEVVKVFSVINLDSENICEVAMKQSALPVDMARFFITYFAHIDQLSQFELLLSPSDMLDCFTNICANALEDICNDKHLDILATTLSSLAAVTTRHRARVEAMHHHLPHVYSFVTQLITTLSRLSASYSNGKKLFVLCTGSMLAPCLDMYSALCAPNNIDDDLATQRTQLLEAVDALLSIAMFDDNNMKELSQISLESIESRKESGVVDNMTNQTIEGKKTKTNIKKKTIFSYHADFFFVIGRWLSLQPIALHEEFGNIFVAGKSIRRLLDLYVQASFGYVSNQSDSKSKIDHKLVGDHAASFVVKWRQHVKRLLHTCLSLAIAIKTACTESTAGDSRHEVLFLLAWSAVLDSVSAGLRGGGRSEEDDRDSGAIPNHDSMTPYLEYMKKMGALVVTNVFAQGGDEEGCGDALYARILFLSKLFAVNYRSMLDMLPSLIQIICKSCNDHSLVTDDAEAVQVYSRCRHVTEMLLLQLLKLYTEIRNLDSFVQVLIVESLTFSWKDHNFVEQFYSLLMCVHTQTVLISAVGSMPDGQRKMVWEAVYSAALSMHVIATDPSAMDEENLEESKDTVHNLSPNRFLVLEAVLIPFVVAQENQNHRPVPTYVLTAILNTVVSDVKYSIENETLTDLQITASLQLIAVLFQVAGTRLSSSIFSPHITSYPYEMTYDQLPARTEGSKPSAEKEWIDFCLIACNLIRGGTGDGSSPLKAIFCHVNQSVKEYDIGNDNGFVGATLVSCVNATFAAISLFSACSDSMSPMARQMKIVDLETEAGIFDTVYSSLKNDIIMDLLSLVSAGTTRGNACIMTSFPIVCNLLMKEFSKWGRVVNTILQKDSSSSLLKTLDNMFMGLVQAALRSSKTTLTDLSGGDVGTKRNLQAHIIHALSGPDIEEIPFVSSIIMQSLGKLFDNAIVSSELYTNSLKRNRARGRKSQGQSMTQAFDVELLAFEMALLQFPVKLLCHNWESLCRSCCSVLHLITNKYSTHSTMPCDARDVPLVVVSINIITEITKEKLSSSDTSVGFIVSLLEILLEENDEKNTVSTSFIGRFSSVQLAFQGSSSAIYEKLCDPFNSLCGLVFQFAFNKLLGSLLDDSDVSELSSSSVNKLNVSLIALLKTLGGSGGVAAIGKKKASTIGRSSWPTFSELIKNIVSFFPSDLLKTPAGQLQDVVDSGNFSQSALHLSLFSIVTQSFSALIVQKPLLLEWENSERTLVLETIGQLEHLILKSVELLEVLGPQDFDCCNSSLCFSVMTNSYSLLVHISSLERNSLKKVNDDEVSPSSDVISSDVDTGLVAMLLSSSLVRHGGWLHLLGEYLHGQSMLDFGESRSYLSDNIVETLRNSVLQAVELSFCNSVEIVSNEYPSVLFFVVKSLLHATSPSSREKFIAKPLLCFVSDTIRSLSETNLFVNQNHRHVFLSMFAVITSLLEFGNTEWKEGTKEGQHNLKIVRICYRQNVINRCCDEVMDICARLLSLHHLQLSTVDIFEGVWNYGTLLDIVCQTLRSQLKLELQNQFEVSQLIRKRKRQRHSTAAEAAPAADSVGRVFDACFSFLSTAAAQLVYLSSGNSFLEIHVSSIQNFKTSVCGLISLLTDVLACVSVPVINSYIGSIVLLFRHLLFVSSSLIVSTHAHPVLSVSNAGKEVMALLGRALMAVASSKHLQKHAYLIVDTISGLSTSLSSSISAVKRAASAEGKATLSSDGSLNFGESNELLREHLFPGIFALFDRCRSSRERKQIFASLRTVGGSRTLYTDLHTLYQQDFKFIGKA